MKKIDKGTIIFTIIIIAIFVFLCICVSYAEKTTTTEYQLSEVSDSIYAYREVVVSSVPAHNYTIITMCDDAGRVITVKSNCNIYYIDTANPYAIVEYKNMIYEDTVTLYVPKDSVEFMGTISERRR